MPLDPAVPLPAPAPARFSTILDEADDMGGALARAEEASARARGLAQGMAATPADQQTAAKAHLALARRLHAAVDMSSNTDEDDAIDPRLARARALLAEAHELLDVPPLDDGDLAAWRVLRAQVLLNTYQLARRMGAPDPVPALLAAHALTLAFDGIHPAVEASTRASVEASLARVARARGDEAAARAHEGEARACLRAQLAREPANTRLARHLVEHLASWSPSPDRVRDLEEAADRMRAIAVAKPDVPAHARRHLELRGELLGVIERDPGQPERERHAAALVLAAEGHPRDTPDDEYRYHAALSAARAVDQALAVERGNLAAALRIAEERVVLLDAMVDGPDDLEGASRVVIALCVVTKFALATPNLALAIVSNTRAVEEARRLVAEDPFARGLGLDLAMALLMANHVAEARHREVEAGHLRDEAMRVIVAPLVCN